MATYCSEDGGDRELFSCPICFEDYDLQDVRRAPKLLLCLHTFCYECTQKLWKKDGSLECSMCRMLHEKVILEDLFDNHVIIQYLQREREQQDLEFARKIDQELRNEFGGSPVMVSENNVVVLEENNDTVDEFSGTIEILDSSDDHNEMDETDLAAPEETSPRVSNMDDQDVEERSDCQNNLFAEFLESLRESPEERLDIEENNEDEVNDEGDGLVEVTEPGLNDSSDDSNEDDSGNPVFSFDRIRDLLRDDDNDDDEEEEEEEESENEVDTNVELNENPTFTMDNIQSLFGYAENDDDDDDDERFHSACDDINTAFWGGDEDLPMHDGSEDDNTDATAYCWQIVNRETLLDD